MRKKTVSVDFDGVLNSYKSGWQGAGAIPDPPVEGALEWLSGMVRDGRFSIVLYSTRSSDPDGIPAMQRWLLQHGLDPEIYEEIQFATDKPAAHLTLDDRALLFQGPGTFPTPDEVANFKPWWSTKEGTDIEGWIAPLIADRIKIEGVAWCDQFKVAISGDGSNTAVAVILSPVPYVGFRRYGRKVGFEVSVHKGEIQRGIMGYLPGGIPVIVSEKVNGVHLRTKVGWYHCLDHIFTGKS